MSKTTSLGGLSTSEGARGILQDAWEKDVEVWGKYGQDILEKYVNSHPRDGPYITKLMEYDEKGYLEIIGVYTVILRRAGTEWGDHWHAIMYVEMIQFRHGIGSVKVCKIAHDVTNVSFSKAKTVPVSNDFKRVVCHVEIKPETSLTDLIRLTLAHWWRTNIMPSIPNTQWPTACTGFTDFLLYSLYKDNDTDILDLCPLTIQVDKAGHHGIFSKQGRVLVDGGHQVKVPRKSLH